MVSFEFNKDIVPQFNIYLHLFLFKEIYLLTFRAIFDAYQKTVFNVALHYTQCIEDAEEITQDVFISVYESLSGFRADAQLKTWLYKVAINKSLDFLRMKKRQKRFAILTSIFKSSTSSDSIEISNFSHPGIELEHQEALQRLFNCINKLPDNQKTVVVLLKIEHLSQIETAKIMGISVKAVESLFQRAKNNLKNLLENEG